MVMVNQNLQDIKKLNRKDLIEETKKLNPREMTYGELIYAQKELNLFRDIELPERMDKKTATVYYNQKLNNEFKNLGY